MEELLNNQKKIRFSVAGASHQNGAAERSIKTMVNMASAILMQTWMICHKETLFIFLANGSGLCCMDIKLDT